MRVSIYTDGGADPNPGVGGWAAILRYGRHEQVLTGNKPHTTNNQMELQAAIAALQALNQPCDVDFYTDSEYVRRGITEWIEKWAEKNWMRGDKPVANRDLWQALWNETRRHQIEWHWVRGHAGNPLNEQADMLARQARLAIAPDVALSPDTARLFLRASCKGNPGPGGWGVVLEYGADEESEQLSGWEQSTTNNRMELTALLEGLRLLESGQAVLVFTTSDYLFQGATKWVHGWLQRDWKKKDGTPVSNNDLWRRLLSLQGNYRLKWVNAKGKQPEDIARSLEEARRLAASAAQAAQDEAR
jgi:ribonuclease HI